MDAPLANQLVCQDYRCCGVCDYKVFIETDEGRIIIASVMNDDDMRDFNINVLRWASRLDAFSVYPFRT